MKKHFFLLIAAVIFLNACNDPIFYNISLEEKILEPRIKGSPTNFVEFQNKMYVASGADLYIYEADTNGEGKWGNSTIGGNILSLAVTETYIYALCVEGNEKKFKRSVNGITWSVVPVPVNYNIFSIYSVNAQLFIGTGEIGNYNISNFDGNEFTLLADTGNKLINGAAFDSSNYYFSTKDLVNETGGGIYTTSSEQSEAVLITNSDNIPFMGIINTENGSVLAISRNGNLYSVNASYVEMKASFGGGYTATGALFVWKDKNDNKLLLAGRQDTLKTSVSSGYTYGYLELEINNSGETIGNFSEPGINAITTVASGENGRYKSTIGKIPVNHIYQAPDDIDSDMTLFASTQKDGIWSYRSRSNIWHWNAEE